jgi:integrase/recombinase XerD
MTDREVLQQWLRDKRPKTQAMYRAVWEEFFAGDADAARTVDAADVQRWVQSLTGSQATKTRKIRTMRSYFECGISLGCWTANPFVAVKSPDGPHRLVERIPQTQEIQALQQAAAADGPDSAALVALLVGTGCYMSEVAHARWRDGDLIATPTWRFRWHEHTRYVPLDSQTVQALATWQQISQPHEARADCVFPSPRRPDKALQVMALHRWFHRLCAAADITTPMTPLWVRHYYAITQLQAGVPLSVVQHRLGHAWILTTAQYEAWQASGVSSNSH